LQIDELALMLVAFFLLLFAAKLETLKAIAAIALKAKLNSRSLDPICMLTPVLFFFCVSDRIRSALGSIYVTDSQENSQHVAVNPRKKMMKEIQNEIQTRNKYAEKIARLRLLRIEERKRKKDQRLKLKNGAI
jgi:hypothetical protein